MYDTDVTDITALRFRTLLNKNTPATVYRQNLLKQQEKKL